MADDKYSFQIKRYESATRIITKIKGLQEKGYDINAIEMPLNLAELLGMTKHIVDLEDENLDLKMKLVEAGIPIATD